MTNKLHILSTRVFAIVSDIPRGRVTTYKAIAECLGTRSYRAIGRILGGNPHIPLVPCHRVVMSDGRLGGYARGPDEKRRLLISEGVWIEGDRVRDFERCRMTPEELREHFSSRAHRESEAEIS